MHEDWSDERLMLAYRDGDAGAFDVLYGRYRIRLHRYLAHQCGNAAFAEELYQDIWIKVINARSDYQPLAGFSTWIFRIAHHRLLDHYRKYARETAAHFNKNDNEEAAADDFIAALPAPQHETPHALADRRETGRRINRALADLPAPQREAFLLAEEGGLSLDEIATATASGRETAKSRLRYAVGKLRNALQDLL